MKTSKHPQQLLNLAAFENQINDFQVDNSTRIIVSIDANNTFITIECNGIAFNSSIERPLIHQLGSRIFASTKEFKFIKCKWEQLFHFNKTELENLIVCALKKHQLVIRYFSDYGRNKIYGIVTNSFNKVNPLEFRNLFLEEAIKTGALNLNSTTIVNRYGEIIEKFDCNFDSEEVKFSYLLHHACNNGYNTVKVQFGRVVIVCSNGLTRVEGEAFKWFHTNHQSINTFVNLTVDNGIKQKQLVQLNIENARNRMLSRDTFNDLLQKPELVRIGKQKIVNQLKSEINKEGANEWALSQCLTWLGTHDNTLFSYPKSKLIKAGSKILDQSLQDYLVAD